MVHPEAPLIGAPRIYLVAAVTVVALGLNWPIMSWGVAAIPPLWLTSMRLLGAAGLTMAVLAASGRLAPPPLRDYPVVASVAIVRLALVYGLAFTALLYVPPGRSSVLVHTGGLWAAPLGFWFLRERLSLARVSGLLLGVSGIVLLMEPWSERMDGSAQAGYAMLLGAALASALGTVHVRGHRWEATPLMLMPWQLLGAAALTTTAALALHGLPTLNWTVGNAAVIGYQVLFASGVGLWGTLTLSRSLPAVSTGIVLMGVPAIGVTSSVLLVDERLTPLMLGGVLLVFCGIGVNVVSARGRPGGSGVGRQGRSAA